MTTHIIHWVPVSRPPPLTAALEFTAALLRVAGGGVHAHQRTAQTSQHCHSAQALEGKDIVARARTGSGKTLAYLLPALQAVLAGGKGRAGWQALILVPSRELCEQVGAVGVGFRTQSALQESCYSKHAAAASDERDDGAHCA
jgi:primosomal protein N'